MTKEMQALAVELSRPLVAAIVRKAVPATRRRPEARQVGVVGVLVALESYKPGCGVSFRALAGRHVRRELARWQAATR